MIAVLLVVGCIELFDNESPEGIEVVEEVWSIVLDDYVGSGELDNEELMEAAINGLLESLDDPYTDYLDPAEMKRIAEDLGRTLRRRDTLYNLF